MDPSLVEWAIGVVAPGMVAGLVAHRWVSAPLRARRPSPWSVLVAVGFMVMLVLFALYASMGLGIWSPSTLLARIALVAFLTVLAGAAPRAIRFVRARRLAEPAQSPYRARPESNTASPQAVAARRATLRLVVALGTLTCVGGWAWRSSRGEELWQEVVQPGAPRIRLSRTGHAAALLRDGRVLVTGGHGPLASCELYNPERGGWSDGAPMGTARYQHTATVLLDGRVLVAGGSNCRTNCTDANSLAAAEVYDPTTGAWTATGAMSARRRGHAAVLLPDGRVLVAGGSGLDAGDELPIPPADGTRRHFTTLRSAEIYDPRTGTWTPVAQMKWGREDASAFVLKGGRVLVSGGMWGEGDWVHEAEAAGAMARGTQRTVDVFDPANGTWTTSTPAPSAGEFKPGITWDLLIPSGMFLRLTGWRMDHAFTYDPERDKWAELAVHGQARGVSRASGAIPEEPAIVLRDGRVLACGGSGPPASDEAWVFDVALATWSPLRPMALARGEHSAIGLASGEVLVFGGVRRGRDYLPPPRFVMTSEIFDPATGTWAPK